MMETTEDTAWFGMKTQTNERTNVRTDDEQKVAMLCVEILSSISLFLFSTVGFHLYVHFGEPRNDLESLYLGFKFASTYSQSHRLIHSPVVFSFQHILHHDLGSKSHSGKMCLVFSIWLLVREEQRCSLLKMNDKSSRSQLQLGLLFLIQSAHKQVKSLREKKTTTKV